MNTDAETPTAIDPDAGAGTLVVPARFQGPPGIGNGGWVAGSLAGLLGSGPVEVTLRAPTPLDTELGLEYDDSTARLVSSGVVAAEAVTCRPVGEDVEFVPSDRAAAAEERFPGFAEHPFPTCFVCGTERTAGDALRIFVGPVDGTGTVFAGRWTPSSFGPGPVPLPAVWAALDCPTGWCHHRPGGGAALLGRLAVQVHGPVLGGVEHVVVSRPLARDGRKLHTAAALYDHRGSVRATARALWITVAAP